MLLHAIFLVTLLTLSIFTAAAAAAAAQLQANAGELFTYKIEPQLFNWTHQVISEQYRYRPSLQGYPDLPSWMRYAYSREHHAGFIYGTPPVSLAGTHLSLDVVALNRQNYETRQLVLKIFVAHKFPTPNVVQMKIDNLNWVHFMDPGRVENLLNIFRKELWPQSETDLTVVFMESAVNMGGRFPLRPQQREGVIVHVGSLIQFSARLKELQEEVRPLYKLPTCTYKRTSVQKIFENAGFKLDWCAFKMIGVESPTEILFHNHHGSSKQPGTTPQATEHTNNTQNKCWSGISRDDVPSRNYIDEFAFAFAIPGVIFAVLLGILSAILCFQHEKLYDPHGEFFFENVFHLCEESCNKAQDNSDDYIESSISLGISPKAATVQMVHFRNDNNTQAVTTLRSLQDPNILLDNVSLRSQSPNNNILPSGPESTTYVRPKPPPYKSNTLGRIGVDI